MPLGRGALEKRDTPDRTPTCDGGGGALGHPLVYMDMGDEDAVECGYCDRRFVRGKKASAYHDPAPRPEGDH